MVWGITHLSHLVPLADDLRVSKNWRAPPLQWSEIWEIPRKSSSFCVSHYQRHHPLHNVHISPLSNNINMEREEVRFGSAGTWKRNLNVKQHPLQKYIFFLSHQISKTMSSIHLQIRSSSVDDLQQPGRQASSNWGGEVSLPAAPETYDNDH